MRRNASALVLLQIFVAAVVAVPADAQPVDVRLEVAGGAAQPVRQAFVDALAGMDEIRIPERDGLADYVIDVTTLCVPDSDVCEAAEAFSVSVVLSQPLTGGALKSGLARTGDDVLGGWSPTPEARAFFQRFRTIHAVWTTHWGPDQVRSGARRLIESLDVRCFQKHRLLERRARMEAEGDTATARTEELMATLDVDGDWLC